MAKKKTDSLGDRMKEYENVTRTYLPRRLPLLIRVDGISFHTLTKGMDKPFDMIFVRTMQDVATELAKRVHGCRVVFVQSDEITLLADDYSNRKSQPWFKKNQQKIVSASASIASVAFNKFLLKNIEKADISEERKKFYMSKMFKAEFDSRAWVLPFDEVINCFIWRQQDCEKNSKQMLGRSYFSHKELDKVNGKQIQEKLFQEHGVNWDKLPVYLKRGACIIKEQYELNNETKTLRSRWIVDENTPIFTQDREYIERYLKVAEA